MGRQHEATLEEREGFRYVSQITQLLHRLDRT